MSLVKKSLLAVTLDVAQPQVSFLATLSVNFGSERVCLPAQAGLRSILPQQTLLRVVKTVKV